MNNDKACQKISNHQDEEKIINISSWKKNSPHAKELNSKDLIISDARRQCRNNL